MTTQSPVEKTNTTKTTKHDRLDDLDDRDMQRGESDEEEEEVFDEDVSGPAQFDRLDNEEMERDVVGAGRIGDRRVDNPLQNNNRYEHEPEVEEDEEDEDEKFEREYGLDKHGSLDGRVIANDRGVKERPQTDEQFELLVNDFDRMMGKVSLEASPPRHRSSRRKGGAGRGGRSRGHRRRGSRERRVSRGSRERKRHKHHQRVRPFDLDLVPVGALDSSEMAAANAGRINKAMDSKEMADALMKNMGARRHFMF